MNSAPSLFRTGKSAAFAGLLTLLALSGFGSRTAHAVDIRISIKVILGPSDEWPDNTNTIGTTGVNLNSETAIRDNIDLTNRILASHGLGYRFVLRNDTVYTLSGFDNSWFITDARTAAFRDSVEDAATANAAAKVTWKWHDDAVNIYLNDSRSGYCSKASDSRSAITIGAGAYDELIVHEVGHFFCLSHTHTADSNGTVVDWADGDGLSDTLDDDADATAANINARYGGVPVPLQPQNVRDDLIFNIMSYHASVNRFTWLQREHYIDTLNVERAAVANGRFRYVAPDGSNAQNGLTLATRVQTIGRALQFTSSTADVVLIQSGNYSLSAQGVATTLTQPATYTARRGPVNLSP